MYPMNIGFVPCIYRVQHPEIPVASPVNTASLPWNTGDLPWKIYRAVTGYKPYKYRECAP